ncbi:MAG: glycoside hydrolase family 95 protein [Paludibaculum sp.]
MRSVRLWLASVLLVCPVLWGDGPGANTLWYRQPAAKWVEALPVGNGRLGGMVFGGVPVEKIQLNEDSIWAGEKRDRNNPEAAKALPEVRRLLKEGRIKEAEALAEKSVISKPKRLPPYQPLGDLVLKFSGQTEVTGYRRMLDLDRAVVRVEYQWGGATYTREVFASAVAQAMVVRLTCDKPGRLSFAATLTREADSKTTATNAGVSMEGQALVHDRFHADERAEGVRFKAELLVQATGGKKRVEGQELVVEGADSVTLVLAAATNMTVKEPAPVLGPAAVAETALKTATAASRNSYSSLLAAHVADHQRLFRRMEFQLEGPASDLPTDERLKRVQAGETDLALETLYFQYGRYLLIASSRPGGYPANLQGIWNDSLAPSWDSKFTININTEMNYWPVETCNLSELHLPLFDLIDKAKPDGRRIAKELYGARGFVLHHNTDGWGHAVPIDGAIYGIWPMGAAWLSLHAWDHYEFTGDRKFLAERAYPDLKEASEFFLDYLQDDGKGHLITGPSISPENRYRTAGGSVGVLCMAPTMDTEITRALFNRLIQASEVLGIDPEFRAKVAAARAKLVPFQVGKRGQLQEWAEDYDEPDPGHRHISPLFALHPDNQITLRGTPELARAARNTLEGRLKAGSGHTGWSRAWIINFWARLEEGDTAHENIVALLAKSTLPNLFDNHPPFQIDGNFGGTAGMAELLLQSHAGEISLLPALPKAWAGGSVKGLKARGNVEVSIQWTAGRAAAAVLKPATAGIQKIRPPKGQEIASITSAGKPLALRTESDGTVSVRLSAGENRVTFR